MSNVFLVGETVDLCAPEDQDFAEWARWFNDKRTTMFLEQGKYPNTSEAQRRYYNQECEKGRFFGLIKTKDAELLGVLSLSEINFEKRQCQVSYVCPNKRKNAMFAPLEALSLGTEHAFLRLGMHRVFSAHAFPGLASWVQKTEILGYQADGVFQDAFRRGTNISDLIYTSITKQRFLRLYEERGGNLWPGEENVKKMLEIFGGEQSLGEKIDNAIRSIRLEHDQLIRRIEISIE